MGDPKIADSTTPDKPAADVNDPEAVKAAAVAYQDRRGERGFATGGGRLRALKHVAAEYGVAASGVAGQLPFEDFNPCAPALGDVGQTLKAVPLADLLNAEAPTFKWVVDGLLMAGGLSILSARPKAGKSTLVRALAVAVARGEARFLDRDVTRGRVLYVGLEDDPYMLGAQLRRLGLQATDPFVPVVERPDAEAPLEALYNTIVARESALTVIDKLADLLALFDINDYAEANDRLSALREVARVTGCHICALHHERKAGGSDDIGDGVIGSTAIFGAVDHLLALRVEADTGQRVLSTRNRYGEDIAGLIVEVDAEGAITTPGTVTEQGDRVLEEEVLEYVKSNVPALQSKVVRDVSGRNTKIAGIIDGMVSRGILAREHKGRSNYLRINDEYGPMV